MIPNLANAKEIESAVVNCFQNCTFTYDSQPKQTADRLPNCCELLSKLYFYL